MSKGALLLIPIHISNSVNPNQVAPYILDAVKSVRHFVVEEGKTERSFIKAICPEITLRDQEFYTLNEHSKTEALLELIEPLMKGEDMILMSDAGCPGIADPGADLVKLCHDKGIEVRPFIGPSSVLLALMASGLNGQNFAFVGYLPKDKMDRKARIKELEKLVINKNQTQLFIETPYRNNQLLEELINYLPLGIKILVACDITDSKQYIRNNAVEKWASIHLPDLSKRPCIFGIGK